MGSGVMNAIVQVESVAGLAGTTHGRLLLAKLAVLVPILVLAAVNRARMLPALSDSSDAVRRPVMRRLAAFVGVEAGLALVLLALAAAMTLTTPARHGEPVWPFPFRLSLDALLDGPATTVARAAGQPAGGRSASSLLIASFLVRRRRAPVLARRARARRRRRRRRLPPLVVDAYPTTYRRPLGDVSRRLDRGRDGDLPGALRRLPRRHGRRRRSDEPAARRSSRAATHRAVTRASSSGWSRTACPERGMPDFESRLE